MTRPRLAVCFSGQPRTWQKAKESWNFLYNEEYDVDIFCHLWNFNTVSYQLGDNRIEYIDKEEIDQLINHLNPIAYKIEDHIIFKPLNSTQALDNSAYLSQYYGILAAADLKKQHEIANDFIYDAVVKMRYDIHLQQVSIINNLDENTIYAFDMSRTHHVFRLSDYFWISDSRTYDIIADLFLESPYIDKKWFESISYTPEHVFFHHLKKNLINIKINDWIVNIYGRLQI